MLLGPVGYSPSVLSLTSLVTAMLPLVDSSQLVFSPTLLWLTLFACLLVALSPTSLVVSLVSFLGALCSLTVRPPPSLVIYTKSQLFSMLVSSSGSIWAAALTSVSLSYSTPFFWASVWTFLGITHFSFLGITQGIIWQYSLVCPNLLQLLQALGSHS